MVTKRSHILKQLKASPGIKGLRIPRINVKERGTCLQLENPIKILSFAIEILCFSIQNLSVEKHMSFHNFNLPFCNQIKRDDTLKFLQRNSKNRNKFAIHNLAVKSIYPDTTTQPLFSSS